MTPSVPTGSFSVYTGRVTNWPFVALSGALLVPLLGHGLESGGSLQDVVLPVAFCLTMLAVNLLTATSVRTTVGPHGVRVRLGALGWPRAGYRIEQIARAEVVTLGPWSLSHGYWWTPWSTWCTVRSGEALRLRLHSGRTVTVTVPDPRAAAAVLDSVRR